MQILVRYISSRSVAELRTLRSLSHASLVSQLNLLLPDITRAYFQLPPTDPVPAVSPLTIHSASRLSTEVDLTLTQLEAAALNAAFAAAAAAPAQSATHMMLE